MRGQMARIQAHRADDADGRRMILAARFISSIVTRHDELGFVFEVLIPGSIAVGIVELFDVHDLLRGRDDIQGDFVVPTFP